MSTRAAIIIAPPPKGGVYRGIYSHSDGYPSYLGAHLEAHYLDPAKVQALIELGDISIIGPEVAPPPGVPHSFDGPRADGVTVAYMRDRGEKGCEAREGATLAEVADQIGHNGHIYTFNEGGKGVWTWRASPGNKPAPLAEVLADIVKEGGELYA